MDQGVCRQFTQGDFRVQADTLAQGLLDDFGVWQDAQQIGDYALKANRISFAIKLLVDGIDLVAASIADDTEAFAAEMVELLQLMSGGDTAKIGDVVAAGIEDDHVFRFQPAHQLVLAHWQRALQECRYARQIQACNDLIDIKQGCRA